MSIFYQPENRRTFALELVIIQQKYETEVRKKRARNQH